MRLFSGSCLNNFLYFWNLTHQKIFSFNVKADLFFSSSHAFVSFLSLSLSLYSHSHVIPLSLSRAVTQLWLYSGPGPQTVTVNQSLMTGGKTQNKLLLQLTWKVPVRLWQLWLVWHVWRSAPASDWPQRAAEGKLLRGLWTVWSPFFWQWQKINSVGCTKPRGTLCFI